MGQPDRGLNVSSSAISSIDLGVPHSFSEPQFPDWPNGNDSNCSRGVSPAANDTVHVNRLAQSVAHYIAYTGGERSCLADRKLSGHRGLLGKVLSAVC